MWSVINWFNSWEQPSYKLQCFKNRQWLNYYLFPFKIHFKFWKRNLKFKINLKCKLKEQWSGNYKNNDVQWNYPCIYFHNLHYEIRLSCDKSITGIQEFTCIIRVSLIMQHQNWKSQSVKLHFGSELSDTYFVKLETTTLQSKHFKLWKQFAEKLKAFQMYRENK